MGEVIQVRFGKKGELPIIKANAPVGVIIKPPYSPSCRFFMGGNISEELCSEVAFHDDFIPELFSTQTREERNLDEPPP